jgi:hypothetical protein
MCAGVVADEPKAVAQGGGFAEVEAGQREAGRGDVDVAVDECRRHETTVEVNKFCARKLLVANIIRADPGDDAIGNR